MFSLRLRNYRFLIRLVVYLFFTFALSLLLQAGQAPLVFLTDLGGLDLTALFDDAHYLLSIKCLRLLERQQIIKLLLTLLLPLLPLLS